MNTFRILLIALSFLSALSFLYAASQDCASDVTTKCPDNTTCCSYKQNDITNSYCFAIINGVCCEGIDDTLIYACPEKKKCKADKTGCE